VTELAVRDGFGALWRWSRSLSDLERAWVIEDCRHVSGRFERFPLDHALSTALNPRPASAAPHASESPMDAAVPCQIALRSVAIRSIPMRSHKFSNPSTGGINVDARRVFEPREELGLRETPQSGSKANYHSARRLT
jgi:hypothetical protein